MITNIKMKRIIDSIILESIIASELFLIQKESTINGDAFWHVKDHFCISKENINEVRRNLTDFEWAGNEIYICSSEDIIKLSKEALGILKQLKHQMQSEYKDTCFDIIISIDEGDEDITPSATIWFYAIRDDYHVIQSENLNEFSNPVLVEKIGS